MYVKVEMTNMEDIIPTFILVLLISEIPDLKAQLDLIIDFIEYDTCDLESERRLLLNLSVSIILLRNLLTTFIEIGKCDLLKEISTNYHYLFKYGRSTNLCQRVSEVYLRRRPQGDLWGLWRYQGGSDDQRLCIYCKKVII